MAITGAAEEVQVPISGDSSDLNDALDGGIDKLNDFRAAVGIAGAALGTLATQQLADAVTAAGDFGEQMANIERVTDAETADRMGDAIKEMANEAPLAHEELAQIAESAGRLGVEGENLEEFTENVSMLSTSTDLAADEAGDALARISTLMDMPIEDSEELGSAINELANNFGTSASEITDAMTRAGGAMESLGVGEDEALGLAAAMNEVSPSARVAGTSLRNISESLMEPSTVENVSEALGMTEEEFRAMRDESPAETINMLATTMNEGGDEAEALRDVLGKQASDLQSLGSNMDSVEGATEAAGKQFEDATALQEEFDTASNTFNARMQILRNRLHNVAIEIGEQLLPHVADALGLVTQLIDWFSKLNDQTDGVLGAVLLVSTAIGGFVAAGAAAISMAGGLTAILGGLATAITGVALPLAAIIAAVAALYTAWETNFLGIRDITDDVIGTVQNIVEDVLEEVVEFWDENGEEIVEIATESIGAVLDVIETTVNYIYSNVIEPVLDAIERVWNQHGDAIEREVRETFDAVTSYIETAIEFVLQNIIEPTLAVIEAIWDRWGDEIETITDAVFGAIELVVEQALDAALTTIRVILALIRGDWDEAWDLIIEYLEDTWDRVTGFLEGDAKDALSAAISILTDVAKDALDYLIGTGDGTLLGDVKSTFGSIADWIADTGTDDVKSAISDLATAVTGVFADTWNAALGGRGLEIPEITIGGGEVAGQDIPKTTIGGGEISIPKLDTGGMIEQDGLAMLHAGEEVVRAAEVDRDGGSGGSSERLEVLLEQVVTLLEGPLDVDGELEVDDPRFRGLVRAELQKAGREASQ